MLTESSVIDQITVLEDGQLQIRRADRVFRDGIEISQVYHRHVVIPGADLTREDPRVRSIGRAVHTEAVVNAYKARSIISVPTTD